MSQISAQTRTLHGYGTQGEAPKAFETEAGSGPARRVVKMFPWAAALPAEMVAHFTREATLVSHLRHPHIVQVEGAGRLANGTPYTVLERLEGKTLE
jgi:serine/threonine protein kinase